MADGSAPAASLDELIAQHSAQPATPADIEAAPAAPATPAPAASLDDLISQHGNAAQQVIASGGAAPLDVVMNSPEARIIKAFGLGAAGAVEGGESQTAQEVERLAGVQAADREHDATDKSIGEAFLSAVAYPAAQAVHSTIVGADLAARALMAPIAGASAALGQAAQEAPGTPIAGAASTAQQMLEFEMTRGDILAGHTGEPPPSAEAGARMIPKAEGAALPWTQRDALIDESHNLVIGQHPDEATYFGLVEPSDKNMIPGEPAPTAAPPLPAGADIHEVARGLAPEVGEYQALADQKDTFRQWLGAVDLQRVQDATAPIDAKIDALLRNPANSQARIESLLPELQEARDQAAASARAGGDSPEMAQIRQRIMDADYRMRDLAPTVADAYRRAAEPEQVVETPEPEPEAAAAGPGVVEPGAERETGAAEGSAPVAVSGAAKPSGPAEKINIAQDVAAKMEAAGRPAEEAQAAGTLIQSHYEARAARFGGAKGTAEQLYAAEAPDIRAGRGALAARGAREMAQGEGEPPLLDTPEASADELAARQRAAQKIEAEMRMRGRKGTGKAQSSVDETPLFGEKGKQSDLFDAVPAEGKTGDLFQSLPQTSEFKRWFGDSKVVDPKTGLPLIVYHGTTDNIRSFDQSKSSDGGFHFGTREQANMRASGAGKNLMPVYLSARNLQRSKDLGGKWRSKIAAAKSSGKDGIVYLNRYEGLSSDVINRLSNSGELAKLDAMGDAEFRRAVPEAHDSYIVFRPEQIKSAIGNRGTFDPESPNILEQARRGKITFMPAAKPIITLFGKADASTFLHETGHAWLEELMRDDADEAAPADLKADAATVRNWLGVDKAEDIGTRQHEQWARGFERYLMEGRAPSKALAGVFERFRTWLTKIYSTVKALRSPITDDIRDVFDRLVTQKPERVVAAADRAEMPTLADIHERDAEETPAEQARPVAMQVRNERDTEGAAVLPPELNDARLERTTDGAGRRQAGGPQPGGNGNAPGADAGTGGARSDTGAVGTGGSDVATPSARALPKKERVAPVYEKVPQRPPSLVDYLRREGGLKDDTFSKRVNTKAGRAAARANPSELRSMNADKVNGLIKARTGMNLDDATLKAWEAGYLPEFEERPTPDDLLTVLRGEIGGDKRYSALDSADLGAYHAAIDKNAEIDRISNDLGISTEGKTRAQFWNEVKARQSEEQSVRDIASQDDASAAAFKEAEDRAKAVLEERGDAWEPDAIYGNDQPRTLEDLERERQSEENAATAAPASPVGSEQPGAAAGRAGDLQAVGGPRGGGVGSGRRAESSIPEPGRKPAEPVDGPERLPKAPSRLVAKAGNIRPENLNTPEDINQYLRETSARNGDFMAQRRGVISASAQLQLADDMGMQPEDLDFRKIGQAFNAEQIVAIRKLLRQTAIGVRDAWVKLKQSGSDEDALAVSIASARHTMVQEHVAGVTAEAGRALGAFRKLAADNAIAEFSQTLRRLQGKSIADIKREAEFGQSLDTTPKVSRWVQATKKPTFGSKFIEYYVNTLISGPITHLRYIDGNLISSLIRTGIETPIAATIGAAREAIAGHPVDRVYYSEILPSLYGIMKGYREGFMAAGEAFDKEITIPLPGESESALPGIPGGRVFQPQIGGQLGRTLRIPGRSVQAIHTIGRFSAYEQYIHGVAARTASREGLTGQAWTNRTSDLAHNPTQEMMEAGHEFSTGQMYMKGADYNSFWGGLTRSVNKSVAAKWMVPFMKVGGNITSKAWIEHMPLGSVMKGETRDTVFGPATANRDFAIAKQITGMSLVGITAGLMAENMMTDGGPQEPAAHAAWLAAGNRPYSFHVGNYWVSYDRLGWMSQIMKFAADGYSAAGYIGDGDIHDAAGALFNALPRDILDENWMKGVNDALNAMFHPQEYGARYLADQATNLLPFTSLLGQAEREIDPYQPEVLKGPWMVFKAALAKIPVASRLLYPALDWRGQPIENRGAITVTNGPDNTDLAMQHLEDMGYPVSPAKLEPKIMGVQLTDRQYYDYGKVAGTLTSTRLDALVNSRGFPQMTPFVQAQKIRSIVDESREAARSAILMQNPSIRKAAKDAKTDAVNGSPRPRGTIEQGD